MRENESQVFIRLQSKLVCNWNDFSPNLFCFWSKDCDSTIHCWKTRSEFISELFVEVISTSYDCDLIWHDSKCQIQVQFEFSVTLKKDQWLRNHGMTPSALVTCQGWRKSHCDFGVPRCDSKVRRSSCNRMAQNKRSVIDQLHSCLVNLGYVILIIHFGLLLVRLIMVFDLGIRFSTWTFVFYECFHYQSHNHKMHSKSSYLKLLLIKLV